MTLFRTELPAVDSLVGSVLAAPLVWANEAEVRGWTGDLDAIAPKE